MLNRLLAPSVFPSSPLASEFSISCVWSSIGILQDVTDEGFVFTARRRGVLRGRRQRDVASQNVFSGLGAELADVFLNLRSAVLLLKCHRLARGKRSVVFVHGGFLFGAVNMANGHFAEARVFLFAGESDLLLDGVGIEPAGNILAGKCGDKTVAGVR